MEKIHLLMIYWLTCTNLLWLCVLFLIYVYRLTLFFEKNGVVDISTYIYNYNKCLVIMKTVSSFFFIFFYRRKMKKNIKYDI